jgi:hypothetical protein
MEDKRGQGLSINAIILIVLGVVILVVLIVGFTMGWSRMKDFFGGSNDLDKISSDCQTACLQMNKGGYCTTTQSFEVGDKTIEASCYALSKTKYGVTDCKDITCDVAVENCEYIIKGSGISGLVVASLTTDCASGQIEIGRTTVTKCCLVEAEAAKLP